MSIEIPLRKGGVALVDERDEKSVTGYNWTLWTEGEKQKGVAWFGHNQTILMHNLIAPFKRVSFRNSDKRDCRRENLIPMVYKGGFGKSSKGRKSIHGNVWLDRMQKRFVVYRKIIENDTVHQWNTAIHFTKFRDRDEAERMAYLLSTEIHSLTREDFIEFVKFRKSKKTTNEIVSEWSCYEGAQISKIHLIRSGIVSVDHDKYGK